MFLNKNATLISTYDVYKTNCETILKFYPVSSPKKGPLDALYMPTKWGRFQRLVTDGLKIGVKYLLGANNKIWGVKFVFPLKTAEWTTPLIKSISVQLFHIEAFLDKNRNMFF